MMMMMTAMLVKMTMMLLISSHLMTFHYKDLEVFQFCLLSSNYAQGDVLREKLLSLSKLRPRYDASTTPNAVPSGNVIEVIVYSQVTQLFHLIYF